MATGKRASMREGPLAQLFRKTEEDDPKPEQPGREEEGKPPREPRTGRPLPEGGPAPQATRRVPEPQARGRKDEPAAERPTPEAESSGQDSFASRATEAARKWSLTWMVWLQELMITSGFFG